LLSGLKELASRSLRRREPSLTPETRIACFREVLHAGNAALGFRAAIEQALAAGRRVSGARVRSLVAGATVQCYRMVVQLNRMTGDRHRKLLPIFAALRAAISRQLDLTLAPLATDSAIAFDMLHASAGGTAGQRGATPAGARQALREDMPHGYGVSETVCGAATRARGIDGRVTATRTTVTACTSQLEDLARVAELIVPLTRSGRLASDYSVRRCRTIYDIVLFCQQAAVEAMFDLGDHALRHGGDLPKLVSHVPIDCRMIDLGGGVREGADFGKITIADVVSRPLRALWKGMADPRLCWHTARRLSIKGFMSTLVNYTFDQDARVRPMGAPSYAFVGADHVNLNSRVGYHFFTVDAKMGATREDNDAFLRFVGGSAGVEQRSRRACLVQRLLEAHGCETYRQADLLNARVGHRAADEMERAARLIGLVVGYANHLDVVLTSDGIVEAYVQEFMAGNIGFNGGLGHG
jgi:hypothetical protein